MGDGAVSGIHDQDLFRDNAYSVTKGYPSSATPKVLNSIKTFSLVESTSTSTRRLFGEVEQPDEGVGKRQDGLKVDRAGQNQTRTTQIPALPCTV